MEAYGEVRYGTPYDPCKGNITSLCPLKAGSPIQAYGALPDISSIVPSVGLSIPNFEGLARIRIFSNTTQKEIGCFQASLSNSITLAQPVVLGTIVGVFVLAAAAASFLSAIYGVSIEHVRMHYAHSVSIMVLIDTYQSFFLTGALAVSWPSVLPAWWSNFAWTAGMFTTDQLVRSISSFTGINVNVTQVGGAGPAPPNTRGSLASQIYGRATQQDLPLVGYQMRRAAYDPTNPYDYAWSGSPEGPGMPMPGTWPGFSGTLSQVQVPPAEAFTLSLIWLLVLLGIVSFCVLGTKLALDLLKAINCLKTDGFDYFRSHCFGYLTAALLRTVFISIFAIMTTTTFQFTYHGTLAPTILAVVVFVLLLAIVGSAAAYACQLRLREGNFEFKKDSLRFEIHKSNIKVPYLSIKRKSSQGESEQSSNGLLLFAIPTVHITHVNNDPNRVNVHQDQIFIKRFGWLTARYRRSRWWFFVYYIAYQFARACLLGGGSRTPHAQVFGFFIVEVLAALLVIKLQPFEGSRNSTLGVWVSSISKVITTGLSIAFLQDFHVDRTVTTVIGIIIVVVQGFAGATGIVLAVLGMFSTWMSLSRNRTEFPEDLSSIRTKYFEHMQQRADDVYPGKKQDGFTQEPVESSFDVRQVRRAPKIEDDDEGDIERASQFPSTNGRRGRADSASSRYSMSSIPRAARVHRASWSSREFAQMQADNLNRPELQRRAHSRTSSLILPVTFARLDEGDESNTTPEVRRPMTPTQEDAPEIIAQAGEDAHEAPVIQSVAPREEVTVR